MTFVCIYNLNWNGEFSSHKTTFSFEYLYKLITFFKKAKRLKSLYGPIKCDRKFASKCHEFLTGSNFLATKNLTYV